MGLLTNPVITSIEMYGGSNGFPPGILHLSSAGKSLKLKLNETDWNEKITERSLVRSDCNVIAWRWQAYSGDMPCLVELTNAATLRPISVIVANQTVFVQYSGKLHAYTTTWAKCVFSGNVCIC